MPRRSFAVGVRFNNLVIIGRDSSASKKHPRLQVRCDCGNEYWTGHGAVGQALSCRKCHTRPYARKYGDRTAVETKLYRTWTNMRYRCRAVDDPKVAAWAGRGIVVCPEWEGSFEAFEQWSLANGYRPGLSIDRLNVDGNYEPGNCAWVTRSVNSKRCRAMYHFVRRSRDSFGLDIHLPIEALFGSA